MCTPIHNSEIVVTFLHPINGHRLEARIDKKLTAEEAILALIQEQFLPPVCHKHPGYYLKVVGGHIMESEDTFQDECTVLICERSVG